MIGLLVIIGVVIIFLIWILTIPFIICVDSKRQMVYLKLSSLLYVSLSIIDYQPIVNIRSLIFSYKINLNDKSKNERPVKHQSKKKRQKKPAGNLQGKLKLMVQILNSFKIKSLIINMDTGNYPLNAMLTPIFSILSKNNIALSVNYEGTAFCYLLLRNRIVSMIMPVIRFRIKN